MSVIVNGKRIDKAAVGDTVDANWSSTSLKGLQNKVLYQELINNSDLETDTKRVSSAINELNEKKQNQITIATYVPTGDIGSDGDVWIVI